jgi:hypothetical protein
MSKPQGLVRPEGLGKLKKKIQLTGISADSTRSFASVRPQLERKRMMQLAIDV